MVKDKIKKLLALITDCSDAELVEVRNIIGHTLGLRRSMGVLSEELVRPGKRGRNWKPASKKGGPQ